MDWGETLEQLDRAVTVPEAVARWHGDLSTMRCVSEGVNVVFHFTANGEGRFIRFTHDSLISERRVASALDFQSHLAREAAPVCKPIASQSGKLIESWPHVDGNWLATVTGEADGGMIGLEHTDPAVYEAWGRSIGMMHRAAETYQPAPDCVFEAWGDPWERVRRGINPWDDLAREEYQRLGTWYATLSAVANQRDFGVTHADCNPNNFLWDGHGVTVIDFDEPSWGWFASDIARALRDFRGRPPEQRTQFREWLLRGYRSVRDFSEFWEGTLNGFIRMKVLDTYAEHAFENLDEMMRNPFCQDARSHFSDAGL